MRAMGWHVRGLTSRGLELRGTDKRFALTLYQDGVSRYTLTLGPAEAVRDECPIVIDMRVGRKVWVEKAESVTMQDVRVIKSVLESLGFRDDLIRGSIGRLHALAMQKLDDEGLRFTEKKFTPRLPTGGLRLLHVLNGSWTGDALYSDRTMREMVEAGYITVEMTPKGREVVEESVRTRNLHQAPVAVGPPEPPPAADDPLGMRVCEACGQETRKVTAGCDHCDLEDK